MKKFTLILLSLVFYISANPQQSEYKQSFGIKASNLSGYGALYGYKVSPKVKLQLTGIYYLFDGEIKEEHHVIHNISIGVEVQRDIIQTKKRRIYLMVGGYYYNDNDETTTNISGEDENIFHAIKNSYNSGMGIGYEHFFHRVIVGFEIGKKMYVDYSKEKENNGKWIPVYEKESKLGAGITLGFIF